LAIWEKAAIMWAIETLINAKSKIPSLLQNSYLTSINEYEVVGAQVGESGCVHLHDLSMQNIRHRAKDRGRNSYPDASFSRSLPVAKDL
jgi:hypothetical protein